jgi:hypothetical protein
MARVGPGLLTCRPLVGASVAAWRRSSHGLGVRRCTDHRPQLLGAARRPATRSSTTPATLAARRAGRPGPGASPSASFRMAWRRKAGRPPAVDRRELAGLPAETADAAVSLLADGPLRLRGFVVHRVRADDFLRTGELSPPPRLEVLLVPILPPEPCALERPLPFSSGPPGWGNRVRPARRRRIHRPWRQADRHTLAAGNPARLKPERRFERRRSHRRRSRPLSRSGGMSKAPSAAYAHSLRSSSGCKARFNASASTSAISLTTTSISLGVTIKSPIVGPITSSMS